MTSGRPRALRTYTPWLLAAMLAAGAAAFWRIRTSEPPPSIHADAVPIRAQIAREELAVAESAVQAWLARAPREPAAWDMRALLSLAQGDLAVAGDAIDTAERLGLEASRVEVLRAILFERSGRASEAQPALLHSIASPTPSPAEVYESLARILLGSYQLTTASTFLERWAHDHPTDPRPYLLMTEIDQRADGAAATAAAIDHYRQALDRAPKLSGARVGLAQALRKANRHDEALAAYDALVVAQPDDIAIRIGRARTLVALGHPVRALADLDLVLRQQPDHAEALQLKGAIQLAQGQVESGLIQIEHSLAAAPFDAETHYLHAQALERLNRPDEARTARDRAATLRADEAALVKTQRAFNQDPTNNALRCEIARWMFTHGQGRQGVRWINTVLATDAKHPEANRLLADYYDSIGESGLANFHRLQAGGSPGTGPAPATGPTPESP